MECDFCSEFASHGDKGRILAEDDGWVLLPTIGCFTPGYCLLMPLEHVDAAADLPHAELAKLETIAEEARESVEGAFGPTILAEHGSRDCQLGASCCTHCHLHLIPVPDPAAVTAAYRASGGTGVALRGLADLPDAADGPYIYLSPRRREHLLWPADHRFARQYVRRVCAQQHGIPGQYDWRDHPFNQNQHLTADRLRDVLGRQPT